MLKILVVVFISEESLVAQNSGPKLDVMKIFQDRLNSIVHFHSKRHVCLVLIMRVIIF